MRFKRRRNTLTFGINSVLIINLILILCSTSALLFYPVGALKLHSVQRSELIFIGLGLASFGSLHQATASLIPTPELHIPSSYFMKNETNPQSNFTLQSSNSTYDEVNESDSHPRRLTKLPKSGTKISKKRQMRTQAPPESAMNRARLLLGSLNRQNCFAKVLCGLGAREPTTKTGLLNDYVYLMEEFVIDDEPDEPKTKSKSKKGTKSKKKKNKNKKPYTKKDKDDSDSSMSKSDEKSKEDLDDKLTDWNFLADATLAQEDPQVLKYVKLEEKRRKYKDQLLPNDVLLERSGRVEEDAINGTEKYEEEPTIQLILPPKSNLRLARQMADEVRKGKTFGGSRRQCRTLFRDQCPFDDIQMAEIITNLRKMLSGRGQQQQYTGAASKTTTKVTTNGGGGGQVQTSEGGSKVEIVLHLNQNGMPYGGYPMPMPMPMHFSSPHMHQHQYQQQQPQQAPSSVANTATSQNKNETFISDLAPPHPPWPQLQLGTGGGTSDPRYPLGHHSGMMSYPPPAAYYPQMMMPLPTTVPTTTTTTPEPTTIRSPGEEQLLDFLYGVVNFNESASQDPEQDLAPPHATKQQNPASTNPYWSVANTALNQAQDVEHQLKIRDKDVENDDVSDSKSKSSEEEELKLYIKSLKKTLKGFAQMNNVTIENGEQVQHSSEEEPVKNDSSQEDFPIPGVIDENNDEDENDPPEESEEEDGQQEESPPKKTVPKKKKIKKKIVPTTTRPPPPLTLIPLPNTTHSTITTNKPSTPRPAVAGEQLFDEDNDDNMDAAVKKLIEKNEPPNGHASIPTRLEDDEYEPEDNTSTSVEEGEDDFEEESNESVKQPHKEQDDLDDIGISKEISNKSKRPPPKILLKFEPIPPEKDPEEMTDKEKKNLVALSAALLPQVPDTFASTPNQRQPVKDVLEEIRIPTAKPIQKAFQSVSNIGKHKIINIDEFADDSGKSPVFPRKKRVKKGSRPQKMRYQTRRKPPMRRPISPPSKKKKKKLKKKPNSHSNSESSEEQEAGSSKNGARGDFSTKTDGPLISLPLHRPQSGSIKQQRPDFYDSLMNYMGMRPVVPSRKELLPPAAPSQFQYGYSSASEENGSGEMNKNDRGKAGLPASSNSFTQTQLIAQPKIGISIPIEFDMGGRDAVEEEVVSGGTAVAGVGSVGSVGVGRGEEEEDPKKGEDEGEKKDKKKKGKDKKDKKKDKKKKKKKKSKKGKKGKGSGGYAMQFHQQVHPGHQETGLWDKIKVFVDTLASTQQGAGETPFIHVGFSETDPLDGNPHAVISDKGGEEGGGSYDSVSYAGGGGGGSGGDDDDTGEEEEEDDIADNNEDRHRGPRPPRPSRRPSSRPSKEQLDLENSAAVSEPEYEGIDYNDDEENNEEDSNESPEVVASSTTKSITELPPPFSQTAYSPIPASPTNPTPLPSSELRQNPETPSPPPATIKTTIAPKPPKYMVDRQQLKIKKKRKKQQKKAANSTTTIAPPIMLRVTSISTTTTTTIPTTSTPPTPTTTESYSVSLGKPPKRRIIYKPPAKRVNIHASPGSPPLLDAITTTTLKPLSSSSLKSTPLDWIKTRVEDDEVEPPSHFFQPGPNGQNVVGRPPVPISAFHIQSEDMLIDTEEDEKLRGGIRRPQGQQHYRPPSPFFAHPYGPYVLRDGNMGDGGSGSFEAQEEEEEDGGHSLENFVPSSPILIATPQPHLRPRPLQIHAESFIDYGNPEEETRGTMKRKRRRRKKNKMKFRPHSSSSSHQTDKDLKDDSKVTSSVMNSPIFSDYFKHLYSSFGQYLSSSSG